jgi:hypothetical protein
MPERTSRAFGVAVMVRCLKGGPFPEIQRYLHDRIISSRLAYELCSRQSMVRWVVVVVVVVALCVRLR